MPNTVLFTWDWLNYVLTVRFFFSTNTSTILTIKVVNDKHRKPYGFFPNYTHISLRQTDNKKGHINKCRSTVMAYKHNMQQECLLRELDLVS